MYGDSADFQRYGVRQPPALSLAPGAAPVSGLHLRHELRVAGQGGQRPEIAPDFQPPRLPHRLARGGPYRLAEMLKRGDEMHLAVGAGGAGDLAAVLGLLAAGHVLPGAAGAKVCGKGAESVAAAGGAGVVLRAGAGFAVEQRAKADFNAVALHELVLVAGGAGILPHGAGMFFEGAGLFGRQGLRGNQRLGQRDTNRHVAAEITAGAAKDLTAFGEVLRGPLPGLAAITGVGLLHRRGDGGGGTRWGGSAAGQRSHVAFRVTRLYCVYRVPTQSHLQHHARRPPHQRDGSVRP
ncbi:hypothetical protein DR_1566 [Deinococcus radiodurans R1 = ATCC 13939 = DSM 20539]|uniref:Uncharacterized protein n=1 Tax=Deinococcus radiodurans (strain ATCC 13939 / DSM 20539 / JCM 16871 / CCUG 27074 / LMG 4051 / NBRC 15346 / NCIMB 9279 / VKM B-1422 / R1) TaxID=243230 RepID=Q9RU29_DEIRA|nr:hypothetical protein DR_1566 [Deinococcus radiodurans R1 = ATCC 13939 = DSM 20539]